MIVNFKDPSSILAWWRINPERHGPQLKAIARLRPQFRAAIKRAAELSTEPVGKAAPEASEPAPAKAPGALP